MQSISLGFLEDYYSFIPQGVPSCMKKTREVTIYDIAKKLNLAASTVSRGLQDSSQIGRETKKKILNAAEKLGYRVNHYARNLRQQQGNTIGVLVHELNSNFITS